MKGVLQSLKSEILKRLCEGCEGFLFKIPGKARVRARVSIGLGKTLFRRRKELEERIELVMSDKRALSLCSVMYALQYDGCSKFFRHFFADFSLFVLLSTHIYIGRGNERVRQKVEDSEQR